MSTEEIYFRTTLQIDSCARASVCVVCVLCVRGARTLTRRPIVSDAMRIEDGGKICAKPSNAFYFLSSSVLRNSFIELENKCTLFLVWHSLFVPKCTRARCHVRAHAHTPLQSPPPSPSTIIRHSNLTICVCVCGAPPTAAHSPRHISFVN